ncbi:zeta toxin family protein [Streptomyces sp. NPDC057429]|uniref:zeta toxin family protein n=1 Tax=Streptomyces sp. NPDC057429 TaxID=3346130 RepID=UPI0036A02FB6
MEKDGELLAKVIVPKLTAGAVAQEHPVVVFVAGQAGSGKTLVMDLVHAALEQRGGAVRLDRDTYKTFHPHYGAFVAENVRTAGVRVRPETYCWQVEAEACARSSRFDVVSEEALADPAGWLATLTLYRAAGYRIEVVALAVPEAVSQLGVLDRYPRLAEEGRARYVGWDNHDACAAALPKALADIEAGRLADRVVVVRRAGEVLYANELASAGRWRQPAGAREALLGERLRPWNAAETGVFRRQLADADRRAHDPRLPEDWALAVRRDGERAAALAEPLRRTAQARREAPGVDYHRLSAEEHRWIFDVLIAPTLLEDITPQERPVAVYVMGQPGSGKTTTARVLRRALRGRPPRISGDSFKAFPPDYYDLLREEPRTAGEPQARNGSKGRHGRRGGHARSGLRQGGSRHTGRPAVLRGSHGHSVMCWASCAWGRCPPRDPRDGGQRVAQAPWTHPLGLTSGCGTDLAMVMALIMLPVHGPCSSARKVMFQRWCCSRSRSRRRALSRVIMPGSRIHVPSLYGSKPMRDHARARLAQACS